MCLIEKFRFQNIPKPNSGSGVLYFSGLKTDQSLRHARQPLQQQMSQKQQEEVSPLETLTLEVYSTPRSLCHLSVTEIRDGMTRGGCLGPDRDNLWPSQHL